MSSPGYPPPPYQPGPPAPEKKAFYKKKKVWIPAVIVAIAAAAGASGSGSEDSGETGDGAPAAAPSTASSPAAVAEPVETAAPADGEPAPAPTSAAPKPVESKPAEVTYVGKEDGDKLASGGQVMLSGWTTTASKLVRKTSIIDEKLLCTSVSLLNRDDESQSYSSTNWSLQTPGGEILDISVFVDNELDAFGELAPGGSVRNKNVCFEIDTVDPGQYVLAWEPDLLSSDRGVWLQKF